MNSISAIINGMSIREREDGRFEARITIDGKRKSFYGSTKTQLKQNVKNYLQKIEN